MLALSLFGGLRCYAQVQSSEPASPVNHAQLLRRASLSSSTMTPTLAVNSVNSLRYCLNIATILKDHQAKRLNISRSAFVASSTVGELERMEA